MSKVFKFSVLTLGLLFAYGMSFGQGYSSRSSYMAFGPTLNAMNYVGDLDPGPSFLSPGLIFTRYNVGGVIWQKMGPRLWLRGAFSYGRIKGSDYENSSFDTKGGDWNRKIRNFSFRNQIYEAKVDAVIDLYEWRGHYRKRPDFTPYAFIGLAYFHHNPQALYNGNWVNLRNYHTEGQGMPGGPNNYSLHQIAFPAGFGLRYKLSKHLDLAFEIGWRYTTTDYLDDVGGVYYDKQLLFDAYGQDAVNLSDRSYELLSNPEVTGDPKFPGAGVDPYGNVSISGYGQSGEQRGDKKGRRDVYIITGLQLIYIIPDRVICPKFK